MKKFLSLLIVLVFTLSVVGCGGDNKQSSSASSSAQATEQKQAEKVESEAEKQEKEQLEQIKKNTVIKDLMNGAGNKAIGKYSIIKMTSSEFDSMKEVWYFKWARDKVDSHEWNYAIVEYTDKKGTGAAYNSVLQVNCQLTKDPKNGNYSIGNGDMYVESDSDKGHLKKFE